MEALKPFTHLFGSTAMVCAIAMALVGLPLQIKKNRLERDCGQPFVLISLAFGVYFFRALYALSISSWYILIPDSIGTFCSAILLHQWYRYVFKRRPKKPPG